MAALVVVADVNLRLGGKHEMLGTIKNEAAHALCHRKPGSREAGSWDGATFCLLLPKMNKQEGDMHEVALRSASAL